jgi:hypothetical protein
MNEPVIEKSYLSASFISRTTQRGQKHSLHPWPLFINPYVGMNQSNAIHSRLLKLV